jgi:hypothetical protein
MVAIAAAGGETMSDLITHLMTFIAGLAAGFVIKIRIDASKKQVSTVAAAGDSQGTIQQSGNTVGGHMSGRDVNVGRD